MKTLTVENIRKIIIQEVMFLETKEAIASETAFIESEINSNILMGSKELRRSISRVEADPDRGEVAVYLTHAPVRPATDRQISCALKNFISELDLSSRWILNPCGYNESFDEEFILIVGI